MDTLNSETIPGIAQMKFKRVPIKSPKQVMPPLAQLGH